MEVRALMRAASLRCTYIHAIYNQCGLLACTDAALHGEMTLKLNDMQEVSLYHDVAGLDGKSVLLFVCKQNQTKIKRTEPEAGI